MAAPTLALMGAQGLFSALATAQRFEAAIKQAEFEGELAERNAEQVALLQDRDAALLRADADREAEALAFDLGTFDRVVSRTLSTTRAQIGASGTEFSGSNLLVAVEQAQELAMQRGVLQFASEQRQADLEDDAAFVDFQAEQTRAAGAFAQDSASVAAGNLRRGLPLALAGAVLGSVGPGVANVAARKSLMSAGARDSTGVRTGR